MMKWALVLAGLFIIPTLAAAQNTWYVPGHFDGIQKAIAAAVNGDTIIVKPGTYVENIDFIGKAITVKSEQGPDVTVIDGGNPANPDFGSVVIFQYGEGGDSILEGFTITNGTGTWFVGSSWSGYLGGGIYCTNGSSPVIRGNVITKNKAVDPTQNSGGGGIDCSQGSDALIENNMIIDNESNWGGGVEALFSSSPKVINNVISGNTIDVSGGGVFIGVGTAEFLNNTISSNSANNGGGMQIETGSPVIRGNIISGNKATNLAGGIRCWSTGALIDGNAITGNSAKRGGGLQMTQKSYVQVSNNLFAGNTATFEGGGVRVFDSEPTLANNVFRSNASEWGGGLDIYENSSVMALNNTFFDNSAKYGGAIACRKGCSAQVINGILWNNSANLGKEILIASTTYPSTIHISYSDVEGGQASADVKAGCTLDWGAGMISADPLFVDSTADDLHLTWPSPCRDAGFNHAYLEPADFEGDPRIASGTADMGADEFHTHLYYTGDAAPGGTVALKYVDVPGTAPVGFWIAFNVLATPMPGAYGDWWLLPPMVGPITLSAIPASGVQVLSGQLPASPPGPYTLYFQAIMGTPLKLSNLCTVEVQ